MVLVDKRWLLQKQNGIGALSVGPEMGISKQSRGELNHHEMEIKLILDNNQLTKLACQTTHTDAILPENGKILT